MTDKAESLLGLDQEKSTARTESPASEPVRGILAGCTRVSTESDAATNKTSKKEWLAAAAIIDRKKAE